MPRKHIYVFSLLFIAGISFILLSFDISKDKERTLGIWDRISPTAVPSIGSVSTTSAQEMPIGSNEEASGATYPVVKVVDGDTVTVDINGKHETIRLIGIDTPESVDPRKPVECFGKEASGKAHEILDGYTVRLVSDPTQGERDKYGRLLRYLFRNDGLFFNRQMVEEGYAHEYTYATPYQYQDDFRNAQERAKALAIGLWDPRTCNGGKVDEYSSIDTGSFVDKDCKDFQTQTEAQEFFIAQGGPKKDPHRLDQDKDGTVCASLP